MSENIDHEAARDCANEAVEFYANNLLANGYRLSNAEQRDYLVSTAYLDLHEQLAAERARVEALVDVIHDANGIAYPFKEMQDKMTAILNAHAQGDEVVEIDYLNLPRINITDGMDSFEYIDNMRNNNAQGDEG